MAGTAPSTDAPPPHAQLIQMATGYWVSRILYAADHRASERLVGIALRCKDDSHSGARIPF